MSKSHSQSFEIASHTANSASRIAALRAELVHLGLDGFLVPRADEHQNEYVAPSAERLSWLTGFAGSAGLAMVMQDQAIIFVDGRYTLQVREEVDLEVVTPQHSVDAPPERWMENHLKAGQKLGYDPWLHTPGQIDRFERAAKLAGASLVPLDNNPLDKVWQDRPAAPTAAIALHSVKLAGQLASEKLMQIAGKLGACEALVISDPHSLAWAFNIRGGDVSHTPLPLGYAIVRKQGKPLLYMDGAKLSNSVRDCLCELADINEPSALLADLARMGKTAARVRLDSATAPAKLAQALRAAGGEADVGTDPIALMKAAKNQAELKGTRIAHIRDGVAMVRFLAWFDGAVTSGSLTEIDAVQALEGFRRDTGKLMDISFPSIAGAGPNAAIPHYRVNSMTSRIITPGLFLIDSGGQYEDGTTDITRTIAVGKVSRLMRDRFTRVLKGHIAIAQAIFPRGTAGSQIDAFARAALWQVGLDFDHGTGHGVGSYLSVHEGPQRISKLGTVALQEGMILSNEPGFYKAGAFGIRIENLIVVEKRAIKGAEREMLGFETISFAPIDLRLIDFAMLDPSERQWLNAYHARTARLLGGKLNKAEAAWLAKATRAIG